MPIDFLFQPPTTYFKQDALYWVIKPLIQPMSRFGEEAMTYAVILVYPKDLDVYSIADANRHFQRINRDT